MIKLENVTLDFPVPPQKVRNRSSERRLNQATGGIVSAGENGRASVRALDNISFTLNPGDKLALLGHNGAGKTTLLRVMAGLYAPTQGLVHAEGRVAPLLNLSFGMDMEATGYDNIWIRGLFLGMSRAEIRTKIDAIASFSELADFLHLPMRTYSSGMRARLAFAISTHVDADILLLDEVIATGDASFFQKARQQLEVVAGGSSILVLASHSNKVLRELCNKGLLLEHGKILAFGPLDEVIAEYKAKTRVQSPAPRVEVKEPAVEPPPEVQRDTRILLLNDAGMLANPGCRAVRKSFNLIFHKRIGGASITNALPVDYWVEHFQDLAVPDTTSILQEQGSFAVSKEVVADIDIVKWQSICGELAHSDQHLQAALAATDLVVLNCDATIHHNTARALALLALAKTAVAAGKKVFLMNATFQQVMPQLLKEVLSSVALVHVREMASKDFLDRLGIQSFVTADLAFLALDFESVTPPMVLDASAHVLVTGGAMTDEEGLTRLFQAVEGIGMRPVYFSLGAGADVELVRGICSERQVLIIEADAMGVKELNDFLRQFPLAISGRHHMNVFLMRAGVPFLPLPSSTWKVEGTLKTVGYPIAPVKAYSDLLPALNHIKQNQKELASASAQSYLVGRGSFESLIDRIKTCIS